MIFTKVDSALTPSEIKNAQGNLNKIILELGVRDNNEHVGTGLGGNNFQLVTLLRMKHELIFQKESIIFNGNIVSWGYKFLMSPRIDIRKELDIKFPEINEGDKIIGEALSNTLKYGSRAEGAAGKYFSTIDLVDSVFSGNYFSVADLQIEHKLLLACLICNRLSCQLDKNETSNISKVGLFLGQFDPEIILLSVRYHIGIERLIRHDLDEEKHFASLLNSVNKQLD